MVEWTSQFINEFALVLVLTIFQLAAIYFALKIGKKLGHPRFWIFMILGFGIVLVKRVLLFMGLFGCSLCTEASVPAYLIDSLLVPLISWIFIALALFELNIGLSNHANTLTKEKKVVRKKVKKKRRKTKKIAKRAVKQQTQPSKIQRFFARKTEDGYIDMTEKR